jgi:hypothetical protein
MLIHHLSLSTIDNKKDSTSSSRHVDSHGATRSAGRILPSAPSSRRPAMNRTRFLVPAVSVLAALGVVAPAPAGASPYCGITWGSQAEHADRGDREVVVDVRAGRHECFDRLVVDVGGEDTTFGSYSVRYVPVVHQDGSGDPVPVRGAAALEIALLAPAHDEQGRSTFLPADRREVVDVTGYRTFRQVAYAGSFEGRTTVALGVRARLPFRVFSVTGTPNSDDTPRLVIDVAHRW